MAEATRKTKKAPAKAGDKKIKPVKKPAKAESIEQTVIRLTKEAGKKAEAQDFSGAIKKLDEVLTLVPGLREALNYKGMMLVGIGENEKAIEVFDEVLMLFPDDKEALNNKGISLYGLGKEKEALESIEKAISVDRRYSDALLNKALILYELGHIEESQTFFTRARTLEVMRGGE